MSRRCSICGKHSISGHKVSHSNIKTNRKWFPNLHKRTIHQKGRTRQILICSKCLKKGNYLAVTR